MELGIFMREHLNGMYRTDTYYLTRQMAEIPIQILTPILFTSMFYWMIGMNPEVSRFFTACLINILLVQVKIMRTTFQGLFLVVFVSRLPKYGHVFSFAILIN